MESESQNNCPTSQLNNTRLNIVATLAFWYSPMKLACKAGHTLDQRLWTFFPTICLPCKANGSPSRTWYLSKGISISIYVMMDSASQTKDAASTWCGTPSLLRADKVAERKARIRRSAKVLLRASAKPLVWMVSSSASFVVSSAIQKA